MRDIISISLTKEELDTIQLGTSFVLDKKRIKTSEDGFVVKLTVDEIDALMEDLGMEEYHAESPKTKKAFKSLYRKLEQVLEIDES